MLKRVTVATMFFMAVLPHVANAANTPVEPLATWAGKIKDKSLRALAPKSGFIADSDTWDKLWKKWRPGQDLPQVDFAKELVLVGTFPGPNLVLLRPTINEGGDVKFTVAGTKIGGPGFGYKLVKIRRKGVRTVNGKPIDAQGVTGMLLIPKTVGSFEGHTLEVKLWEYDPRLADASAKLVDEFTVKKFAHGAGKETATDFSLGAKLEPRKDRGYYITAFILQDGKRTHIAERDGKRGLCKVLEDGKPTSVKMVARPVK